MTQVQARREANAWRIIYRVVLDELRQHEMETDDTRKKAADVATMIVTSPGVRMQP
jgi:hypothetical protein